MQTRLSAPLVAAFLLASLPASAQDEALAHARAVLARTPVFDGHHDLAEQLREQRQNRLNGFVFERLTGKEATSFMTDLYRLKAGGYGGVFWSVYVDAGLAPDEAVRQTIEQIDVMERLIERYPDHLARVSTVAEARAAMRQGRIAGFYGAEGGHSINNSLGVLRQLYRLGCRYLTLTHFRNTAWADSATDAPVHQGLTTFGRDVVREMNRLGMLVDLSHVSEKTMSDALETSAAPVIFSHSGARALDGHPRNVPDAILRRLRANGGVVMVDFAPDYVSEAVRSWTAARAGEEARLSKREPGDPRSVIDGLADWEKANPRPKATVEQVADHIDHIRAVSGIDAVGIGSDFDGISSTPQGLGDVSAMPNLFAALVRRGYSDAELGKIAQGNILRAMERAEAVSARLRKETVAGETAP